MNIDKLSLLRERVTDTRLQLIRLRDEWIDLHELPAGKERARQSAAKLKEIEALEHEERRLEEKSRRCQTICTKEFAESTLVKRRKEELSKSLEELSNQAGELRNLQGMSLRLGLDVSMWNLLGLVHS
ncbi:MAG: hypothetical protein OEU36_20565, partial [Gammaproteobacteria bacterium]|nr:hypothetical protein [Gammaproteobacteria bacterium]